MATAGKGQYSELSQYFKSVSRMSMLSPAEEAKIARELVETGRQRLADRLVSANLRFVIKIALEYKNYGFPMLDLIQEGNLGLVRAVKSFDPEKGYRLISYAVWWIRAYIQEFILKNWSLVKIGTTQLQRRLFNHLQSAQKRIKRLVEYPDEGDRRRALADAVGGTVRDVEEMERRMYCRDMSLDTPLSESEPSYSLHEKLASFEDSAEDLVGLKEESELRSEVLAKALSHLEQREKTIVMARHLRDKAVTLRELGETLGISKERVRQLESRALKTLKQHLSESELVGELLAA
jgi:RNA polymerase sigma-32 factor